MGVWPQKVWVLEKEGAKDTLWGFLDSAEFLAGMFGMPLISMVQELLGDDGHLRGKKRMESGEQVVLKLDPVQAVLIRD